ncbi:hypothetical protein BGX27_005676 [Mortierella sp. AM989]|nr:hypothetical protein BGX27_005676 [Mortierella sp. AM989]
MKQYAWKPPKNISDDPSADEANILVTTTPKKYVSKKTTAKELDVDKMDKNQLIKEMKWEHPTVTLNAGSISANVSRALKDDSLASEVERCLHEVVDSVSTAKRQCQQLIGRYIERITAAGTVVDPADREILDRLCARVEPKDKVLDDNELKGDDDDDDHGPKKRFSVQRSFFVRLLQYLYSKKSIVAGKADAANDFVSRFVDRAATLDLLERRAPVRKGDRQEYDPYPATALMDSAGQQLEIEFKKHYRNGTLALQEKYDKLLGEKQISDGSKVQINSSISAIENFVYLNRAMRNPYVLVPLTRASQPFILFSERDLGDIFWQNHRLRPILLELCLNNGFSEATSQADVRQLIQHAGPGLLIARLLSSIGGPKPSKGRTCLQSTTLMSVSDLRLHINELRQDDFDPKLYSKRGYTLRGSIRTDGFRLQLLAFKLKELHMVKYRRLPLDRLPLQITSTIGGADYYLTEIRNVVRTPEDVSKLWGCAPEQIKILGIDLGQACVVGASAVLPDNQPVRAVGQHQEPAPTTYINLAVKQKAVYQPAFKHRRWMEEQKAVVPEGLTESVSNIETNLPPLCGEKTSFESYYQALESAKGRLDLFYNGNNGNNRRFKKHAWDASRARDVEFRVIANRLLGMVGGTIGRRRDESDKVVIGARSLGYIVVGVNEYYTSKKCPTCEEFVGQVEIRRLYCPHCKTFMHRDVMAGHNICNAIRGHLHDQQRPLYLQPVDEKGEYPWMRAANPIRYKRKVPEGTRSRKRAKIVPEAAQEIA